MLHHPNFLSIYGFLQSANECSSKLDWICHLNDRMSASIPGANGLECIYATMNVVVSILHGTKGPFEVPGYAFIVVTEMRNPLLDALKEYEFQVRRT